LARGVATLAAMSQEVWRVVITVSLDGDHSSVRKAIDDALTSARFSRRGRTATWETTSANAGAASTALKQTLDHMAERSVLDHMWIYIERDRTFATT
jgi:hypothetical protein